MQLSKIVIGVTVAHLVAAAGCYEPQLRNCTIACSGPGDCTGGQVCSSDGFCAMPDITTCTEYVDPTPDAAAVATDTGSTPDAIDLCAQGCSGGTCVGGVCVIDCSATDSCTSSDVLCPANLPCKVICGETSCAKKIRCSQSSSCSVECTGLDSCNDEILCPVGKPCHVTCSGESSCDKRVKCGDSCACDVICSGAGSCNETSECPSSLCWIGDGCTSTVVGCDSCSI